MTEASLEVLEVLRSPEKLQWHVVPLIALVIYIYDRELEKKRHGEVFLGIYFLSASGVLLEIVNALALHFSGRAALWRTPGNSPFVIYAGRNVHPRAVFESPLHGHLAGRALLHSPLAPRHPER